MMRFVFALSTLIFGVASTRQDNPFGRDINLNPFRNVSKQCVSDTEIWMKSLEEIFAVVGDCVEFQNCTDKQAKVLENNQYAIKQLDAFGRIPSPGLLEISLIADGSYQECQGVSGVKYETNYCYLVLVPGKNAKCPSAPVAALKLAVCMPNSCGKKDLVQLFNDQEFPFTACDAYCSHFPVKKDSAFWGFSVFLMVMVIIAIIASVVDYIRDEGFGIPSSKERILPLKILLAFSFWTNASTILSVKEQKPGFIKSLDCIRLFSMSWVVAGHSMMWFLFGNQLLPVMKVPKSFWNHIMTSAVLSVDTFFILSGIVVTYLFFKTRPKMRMIKNPITWILFYVHRYLRLTPTIMLFIGFYTVYAPYIQGAFSASQFNKQIQEVNVCKSSWWKNLLYINNFGSQDCYAITWYLAVDTQLYLVAPILLIAFYFSFAAGTILTAAGCVASIIAVYVLYSVNDLPGDFLGNGKLNNYNAIMYSKPWTRCPPYLIGILTGYIIATYNNKKIRGNWAIAVVGWVTAFGIACACIFANYDYDAGSHWSIFTRASYYNFSRIGWSFAVCWVILANHFGYGGPINNFMSHPIWQPFGRLSYCAYIVHWMVILYFMNVGERPLHLVSLWQVYIYYAIPSTFLSFIAAFFWSCMLEVPVLKLEKMLIVNRHPKIPVVNSFKNVSAQCAADTKTWLNSLAQVALVVDECVAFQNCTKRQMKILEENAYALKQLDAFGRFPSPGLLEIGLIDDGSYQECQEASGVKYDTNYCYLLLMPGKNAKCPAIPLISLKVAVCMSDSCGKKDLVQLFNDQEFPFTACDAYCAHFPVKKDSAFWGFSIFLIIMVSIAIIATILDYLIEEIFGNSSATKSNFFLKILLAFSFWTNASTILSVKEQKPGFIKSLDCIRMFSMSWVVSGHSMIMFLMGDMLLPVEKIPKSFWNHIMTNAVLSVDTFFILSGIVVTYLFFKTRPKMRVVKNPITWILFYVHRYLRLTPTIMLFIGFYTVYAPYIQGPFAASQLNKDVAQANMCKSSWWRNLLYINNFDNTDECYPITWYLAVDTQLYLVAPILLIAFYFSFAAGTILTAAGCVASIIAVYILYSVYDLPADLIGKGDTTNFQPKMYAKAWTRCPPYLIGILTGYIIATYNNKKIRGNWAIAIVGWVTAFGIACACIFANYDYDAGSHWSTFTRASYYNFSRIGWSFAVCWVILANHFGYGGPINNFMSHPIWQPFGRLSYCAYIVHWTVISYFMNVGERPLHLVSLWQVYISYSIPCTFLAFFCAFFWSCMFELPILKLEKMLIEGLFAGMAKPSNKIEAEDAKIDKTHI
ncbi:unnamed protein product [Caenorhabditis bovis]|uniref:Nose resistant-to-fluoxetine protein N-terminal domain-containing protein n=1 Tax=Caenorhabditis bovis TaxID=2654633 RepID=A0A8S1E7S2_9PELO|nr:unnamed protein product [Caenorhabditis bovis]